MNQNNLKALISNLSEDIQKDILEYLKSVERVDEKAINRAVRFQKILTEDSSLLQKLAQ